MIFILFYNVTVECHVKISLLNSWRSLYFLLILIFYVIECSPPSDAKRGQWFPWIWAWMWWTAQERVGVELQPSGRASYKHILEPSLQLQGSCLIIGLWYHPVIKTVKTSVSLGWWKGVKYKSLWEAINVLICFLKIHVLYHVPWPWSPLRLPGLEEESPRWRFHSAQLCAREWSRSREREKSWIGMCLTLQRVIPNKPEILQRNHLPST